MATDQSIASYYQVLEELGRGSFGIVYKALDKSTGETVALKLIDLEESDDDIQEIQQEIAVLSTCESPFVTQYKASYLKGHKLWIAMEYLGGGSCHDLLKAGNFAEVHVAAVCRELLRGLEYLHNAGKIHRDIKAANILLCESGRVKLADFGVAAQLTNIKSMRNTFVGTPYWMAPEVIQQAGYDFRADIWSLGITAMELALGEPPNGHIHPMKVLLQIPKNAPPRLEGNFSREFKDFIAQCLVKDPDRRPSAKELLRHRFIRSAGKVECLQELIERKRMFDASKDRKSHNVYYQETLHTISGKDEPDEWVFDTVKSVAPPRRPTLVKTRKASAILTADEMMRKLDLKDGPLQPSSPAPGTVRKSTVRRQPSLASIPRSRQPSLTGSPRGSIAPRRPLQPDMSFGNTGSTTRLFRRVPSDGSTTGQTGSSDPFTTNENQAPDSSKHNSIIHAPEPTTKQALLGHRLFAKAIDPALAELHAQTSSLPQRAALAKLADAFTALDAVDPEGAFYLLQGMLGNISKDTRLDAALLQPALSPKPADTPQGTVIIKPSASHSQLRTSHSELREAPVSPTKLVLSNANPHLKSHRRRNGDSGAIMMSPEKSPEKRDRAAKSASDDAFREEKAAFEARLPGRPALPGMEHTRQLSELLYKNWIEGLRGRWPNM